ncbi:MAG: hypothetical protein ACIAS6_03085 [Phycisphaerales bacterium JB060]
MPDDAPAEPELLDHAPPGAMCLGCRYDISGMDIRAKCPECGDRIAPSVNFISLEHSPPPFLAALDSATRGLNKASLIAVSGLALLCASYALSGKGLPPRAVFFGTIFGTALLLVSLGVAGVHQWALTAERRPGEEQKAKAFRTAIRVMLGIAAGTAVVSCVLFALSGAGRFPMTTNGMNFFLILWMSFVFVPAYTVFYLQLLAQRSRHLSPKVLMGLALVCMAPMITMPQILSFGSGGILKLFGVPYTSRLPATGLLPIDSAYVWPLSMAVSIVVALIAIAYFRKGLGFTATSEGQPPASPRS